jgi:hypothetical protein
MIVNFAANYPIFVVIASVIGILRIINKPLFALLHAIASITKSEKDNEILAKVESSKAYALFCYLLDYVASIKIKK